MAVNRNERFIPKKDYFGISPGMIRQLLIQHGLDAQSVEPIAQTMHRLYSKFGADERLNYDVIEKFMNLPSADGQRSVVFTIAADNSSDATKARADYVCDGTADQVEIQAAIDACDLINRAGCVQLMEGVFEINGDINLSTRGDMWLRGSGIDATFITGEHNINVPTGSYYTITDIEMRGNVIFTGIPSDFWMERVECNAIYSGGAAMCPDIVFIAHCIFDGSEDEDAHPKFSVDLDDPTYVIFHDNYVSDGIKFHDTTSFGIFCDIHDNISEGSMYIGQQEYLMCHDNVLQDTLTIVECGNPPEDATADRPCIVHDNILDSTIFLTSCHWVHLHDNSIEAGVNDGIVVTDSNDCSVVDNIMQQNGAGDLAGALIDITGTSERMNVHGNVGRTTGDPLVGLTNYFLRIGASCVDTKAYGNDGFGTWDTAAVLDSGTGSDLTSANR